MTTHASSARKMYRTRKEVIQREIIEPVQASGVVELTEAQIEYIAHRVISMVKRPSGARYMLNPRTNTDRFWQIVEDAVESRQV